MPDPDTRRRTELTEFVKAWAEYQTYIDSAITEAQSQLADEAALHQQVGLIGSFWLRDTAARTTLARDLAIAEFSRSGEFRFRPPRESRPASAQH